MLDSKDKSRIVKELRSKLNLSQEELAAKLKVSFATVNRCENEKYRLVEKPGKRF